MVITYLSRKDIEQLGMIMREVLDAVDNGFRLKGLGKTEMPPDPEVHPEPDCFIRAMPAYVQEVETAGLTWVSGYPFNVEKGLPYLAGLLILNDPETGVPIAVMDCSWITAMRTGASAGISAAYLARRDSKVAGILGCGVQSRTSLMALVETLPELVQVRCHDVCPDATRKFIEDMGRLFPALDFVLTGTPAEMVEDADVVVTALPILDDPDPSLDAGMLKQGGLAISLDYDSAWTGAAMAECDKFCSDDVGLLLSTRQRGTHFRTIPDGIYADLGELAAGLKLGRESKSEIIFSMNMGTAVDDIVTARMLYDRAQQLGAGTKLPL